MYIILITSKSLQKIKNIKLSEIKVKSYFD